MLSRSSPDFLKLNPSPTTLQNFEMQSPSPNEVQKVSEMQLFHNKNAAFLFHSLSPNPVRFLNFEVTYRPDPMHIEQNLLYSGSIPIQVQCNPNLWRTRREVRNVATEKFRLAPDQKNPKSSPCTLLLHNYTPEIRDEHGSGLDQD